MIDVDIYLWQFAIIDKPSNRDEATIDLNWRWFAWFYFIDEPFGAFILFFFCLFIYFLFSYTNIKLRCFKNWYLSINMSIDNCNNNNNKNFVLVIFRIKKKKRKKRKNSSILSNRNFWCCFCDDYNVNDRRWWAIFVVVVVSWSLSLVKHTIYLLF